MTKLAGYQTLNDPISPIDIQAEEFDVFRAGSLPDDILQGLGTFDASDPSKFALLTMGTRADGTHFFSGDRDIDSALIGSKWTLSEITYSFPTDGSQYPDPYDTGQPTFQLALTAAQQAAAQYAFGLISSYTNMTFRQINEGENGEHATLRLSQTLSSSVASAMGYFPGPNYDSGDIWFGRTSQPFYDTPEKGNWGFSTFLHEIGHTMGLKHGHQDYTKSDLGVYFGLDPSTPRYGSQATPTNHDGQAWTLMTYRSDPALLGATVFSGDQFNQPQSYMQNDIAALQYMYGANYTTNATDTVYTWSETTGRMSVNGVAEAVAPNSNTIFSTLWDGGGNDTFDLQNYDNGVSVDLRPGGFSTFSVDQLANNRAYTDGLALAPGNVATALLYQGSTASLIENAIGGDGNDVMIGNQVANSLKGGMGNDILQGEGGNDTLDGGAGSDTAVFVNNTDGVSVTLNNGADVTVISSAGTDLLKSIENVVGGHGDDNLVGDDANNMLDGGVLGHDTLKGGAGDDQLIGSGFVRTASDLPDLTKPAAQDNGSQANAVVLTASQFDTAPDADINESTTLPHVTINATATGGTLEYYAVTVNAGDRAIFDIDTFASTDLDSWIELTNSSGTVLANNDTGNSGDSGGFGNDDALLSFTFTSAGTYYIRVGQWTPSAGASALPLTAGQEYTLNISLSSGNTSTFTTTDTGTGDLDGGAGNDFIVATVGDDLIAGGADIDTLSYRQAYDFVNVSLALQGAAQNTNSAGNDTITGIENLTGSAFNDILTGDDNNNVIEGGAGNDSLFGGLGADTVSYAGATAGVAASMLTGLSSGGAGVDSINGFENMLGSAFNDTLTGSAGLNSIVGGDGDDFLNGGGATGGVDTLVGGNGIDTASFAGYTNDITADLMGGDDDITGDTVAVFSGIEGIEGGSGNDNLLGSNTANKLIGNDGNDVLLGRGGNDTLKGGLGDDRITGGGGIDTADYSGTTGVTLDLNVSAAQNTGVGMDTVTGVENVITGSGADSITGTSGANTITEGGGNDTINGGGGVDTIDYSLMGAAVNVNLNTVVGQNTGAGTDTITNVENLTGTAFGDSLTGQNAITTNRLLGGGGTDLIQGNTGGDYIEGGDGADLIAGDANGGQSTPDGIVVGDGNDTIYGGQGADVIIAGQGNDYVEAGTGNDTIVQGLGTGTRNVGAGTATLTAIFANDGGDDTINGGEGSDTAYLFYTGRADSVHIDISNPVGTNVITVGGVAHGALIDVERMLVRGGANGDSFVGGISADQLIGNEGNDTIDGGIGNDSLNAGIGDDVIIGGQGIDNLSFTTVAVSGVFPTITVDLAVTTAQNTGEGMDTISGVENLNGTGGADIFSGDGMFNVFTDAVGGNDVFSGRGGNDTLTMTRSGTTMLASNVSLDGGDGNDFLTLTSTTRTISAVAQFDNATVVGGNGNDTISVTGTGINTAAINAGAGADVVTIGVTAAATRGNYDLTLGQGSDIVQFSGTGAAATTTARTSVIQDFQAKDGGDRFELTNFLNGSGFTGYTANSNAFASGHIRLVQGVGAQATSLLLQVDRDGSAGGANSFVTIMELKNGLSKGFTNFNFDGMQMNNLLLTGTDGADIMAGGTGNDTLLGGLDRDFMEGGLGDDTFDGGDAPDTVSFENAAGAVTVDLSLAGPQNTGVGNDTFISIEHLLGSSFNDTLTGAAGFNSINGANGDDLINGGTGEDRLTGGEGNDTINGGVDTDFDRIDGGAGIDTVSYAGMATGVNVDLSTGTSTGSGPDTLQRIENILGGDGNDTLTGSSAANKIEGGAFNDVLNGGNGADTLIGGSGEDTLTGGRHADLLTGGAGNDRFVFDDADKIVDTITDLENTDTIDVSAIDANGSQPGDPGFTLVGSFTHVRGQLIVTYDGTNTHVQMDTNGDGVADRSIDILGDHHDFTNFAL